MAVVSPPCPGFFGTLDPKTFDEGARGAGIDRTRNWGACEAARPGATGGHKRGGTGFAGPAGAADLAGRENRQASGCASPIAGCTVHRDRAASVSYGAPRGRPKTSSKQGWDEQGLGGAEGIVDGY